MERRKKNCPSCLKTKFWKTGDGRLKCRQCRKTFKPKNNPCRLREKLLRRVISEFVLEHSTNVILERVKITKHKLLKTLRLLRVSMIKDVPPIFEGIVEVDETYVGGQWRNKRLGTKENISGIKTRSGYDQATSLWDLVSERQGVRGVD